jgi:hypothetical protein
MLRLDIAREDSMATRTVKKLVFDTGVGSSAVSGLWAVVAITFSLRPSACSAPKRRRSSKPDTKPVLLGFIPTSGPVGTVVAIAGSGLASVTSVLFGGAVRADATSDTIGNVLQTKVPSGAASGRFEGDSRRGPNREFGHVHGDRESLIELTAVRSAQHFDARHQQAVTRDCREDKSRTPAPDQRPGFTATS